MAVENAGKDPAENEHAGEDDHRETQPDREKDQISPAEIASTDVALAKTPDEEHDKIHERNHQDKMSDQPLASRQRLFGLIFRHGNWAEFEEQEAFY